MAVSAFNLGGGVRSVEHQKKTVSAGANILLTFPKCEVLVVAISTKWSDRWNSDFQGVVSGKAEYADREMTVVSSLGKTTYVYKKVAEGTQINFGNCPWETYIHIVMIK